MIYGERVRLRGVEKSDLPRFVNWLNDPDVVMSTSRTLPLTMEEESHWFDSLASMVPPERPLAIDFYNEDEWHLIGSCSFHNYEPTNRSAEIGIAIGDKSVWDQGYGTETIQLMLKHGFETLNLNRIYLRVLASNQRAIHVYEKTGFVHEGRMRQAIYKHGRYEDMLLMSILRAEWKE